VKWSKIKEWRGNKEIKFPVRIVEGDDMNKNIIYEETIIIKQSELQLDNSGNFFDIKF